MSYIQLIVHNHLRNKNVRALSHTLKCVDFPPEINKTMLRETISHAYVVLTSQLFGGKVVDYDNAHYKKFGDPDVINDCAEQIFEVKSSSHERRLDLKISQIMNYERAQKTTGYENYYVIWAFRKRKRKNT